MRTDTEETWYADRSVRVTEDEPAAGGGWGLSATVASHESSSGGCQSGPHMGVQTLGNMTRQQWETLKRIGDEAWNAYEAKWGDK